MRHLVVPLALAALLVSGCQASPDAAPITAEVSTSASPTPSATPTPSSTPTPGEIISPDLNTSTSCSVTAGKYPTMTKGVRFTARSTVVNRGNIGAAVVLKATWTGHAVVHRAQTISVGYGKKVKVTFNAPTSGSEASAFRANGVSRCGVTVKVLSFLGKPRPAK
jgi:hypothetical protein